MYKPVHQCANCCYGFSNYMNTTIHFKKRGGSQGSWQWPWGQLLYASAHRVAQVKILTQPFSHKAHRVILDQWLSLRLTYLHGYCEDKMKEGGILYELSLVEERQDKNVMVTQREGCWCVLKAILLQ